MVLSPNIDPSIEINGWGSEWGSRYFRIGCNLKPWSFWRGEQHSYLGGGNSKMFYFHPYPWGNDPIWLYFSRGLKPSTSYVRPTLNLCASILGIWVSNTVAIIPPQQHHCTFHFRYPGSPKLSFMVFMEPKVKASAFRFGDWTLCLQFTVHMVPLDQLFPAVRCPRGETH